MRGMGWVKGSAVNGERFPRLRRRTIPHIAKYAMCGTPPPQVGIFPARKTEQVLSAQVTLMVRRTLLYRPQGFQESPPIPSLEREGILWAAAVSHLQF